MNYNDVLNQVNIHNIIPGLIEDGYQVHLLATDRGTIETRYYPAQNPIGGILWVGGIGGGFDSPCTDLYPVLCKKLRQDGFSSLRLKYRISNNIDETTHDALAGIKYLQSQGLSPLGLVGWSFGGATVIRSGVFSQSPKTIVTFAAANLRTEIVGQLPADCSLLMLHGTSDEVLPTFTTTSIFDLAHEPKKLMLIKDNCHNFLDSADELKQVVYEWLLREMRREEEESE